MSFYASIEGYVKYPDGDSFLSMVNTLRTGGWMDVNGYFLDECGNRISEGEERDADLSTLTITIPCWHHRNLSRVEFFTPGATGEIVGTSTDGCFIGWTIKDGEAIEVDLEKWAAANMEGDDRFAPVESNFEDADDYFANLCEWQQNVEMEFFADNAP